MPSASSTANNLYSMPMCMLLLPLRLIIHGIHLAWLIQQRLALLAICDLLFLLQEIAGRAAARTETIFTAVSCEPVVCTHFTAIEER